MKTFYLSLFATLAAAVFTQAHAQIILGSFYNSDPNFNQSINTVADFTSVGVTGPGGAALDSSDTVTGFDFAPLHNTNAFNGTTFTSGGLTLASPGGYYQSGSGVFQSSVFNPGSLTLSGLSGALDPNTTYTLYVFSNPIGNNTTEDVSFQYGAQSGSVVGTVAQPSVATFTFTTDSSVIDGLSLSGVTGTPNPGADLTYPSITGFAIVEAVPEPASYVLILTGLGVLVLIQRRRQV